MPDEQKPADEMIRGIRIMQCLGFQISPPVGDNQVGEAVLIFTIEDKSKFAVTLPVVGMKALRSLIGDVCDAAEREGLANGMVVQKFPHEVTVGHTALQRNCVAIIFNPNMRDEQVFVLPDKIGLEIADALQKDIFSRMSDKDRRDRMMATAKIFGPPKRKLILPPGQS